MPHANCKPMSGRGTPHRHGTGHISLLRCPAGTRCAMRAWWPPDVWGGLAVVLALTVPGPVASIAGGLGGMAQAQDAAPPPGEPNRVQLVPIRRPPGWKAPEGSDRVAIERLFGEWERLTRGLEPKRMQTIRIKPDSAVPAGRPR